MLNVNLLKETLRESRKLWLSCTLILSLSILLCECIYGTGMGSALLAVITAIPGLSGRLGSAADGSLTSYIGTCVYGAAALLVPAVYSAVLSVKLLSGRMEDGSMAALVSMLGDRTAILFTEGYWMVVSLLGMFVCTSASGLLFGALLRPGKLEAAQFLLLNAGAFCFHLFLGGICFFLASLIKRRGAAIGAAVGFLAVSFFLFALAEPGNGLGAAGYFSVFSFFWPGHIILGSMRLLGALTFQAAAGLLFYRAAGIVFRKADIPS